MRFIKKKTLVNGHRGVPRTKKEMEIRMEVAWLIMRHNMQFATALATTNMEVDDSSLSPSRLNCQTTLTLGLAYMFKEGSCINKIK